MTTIADDSGLEVSCLNGEPGILSARWADQYGGFDSAMLEILKRVRHFNSKKKLKIQMPDLFVR